MNTKTNFAWPVTAINATIHKHLIDKTESIKGLLEGKKIIIFGAGIRGCFLLHILEQFGFSNIAFCDSNSEKHGQLINRYDIVSLDKALQLYSPKIFLVSPENSGSMNQQLIAAGLTEGIDWISFDISLYDTYVEDYLRPATDHMLVFGDCAFSHVSLADAVTDSLGKMMKSQFGEDRCKILAMHGIGQQADYHILRALLDSGEKPLLLLLLVMEVLTPKAHLMPRTQHPALIKKLVDVTENPRDDFREYAKIAEERFNRFQVESFASFNANDNEQNEKLFMKMNYLFKIREETEGVVFLKNTIRMLNDAGIPIVLYIPPVNYMQGEKFFGAGFKDRYMDNFAKLYGFLNSERLEYNVADASFLLTDSEFAAANTIDETSNYEGRKKLLKFIEENRQVKRLFG